MAADRVEILRRAAGQLSAREGWRIREGSYRVLYQIDDAGRLVVVVDVGPRREIYR